MYTFRHVVTLSRLTRVGLYGFAKKIGFRKRFLFFFQKKEKFIQLHENFNCDII